VGDVQRAAVIPDGPGHAAAAGLVAGQGAVDDVDRAADVVDAAGAVGEVVRDGAVANGQRPTADELDAAAVLPRAEDGVGDRQAVQRDVGGADEEHAHARAASDREVRRPRTLDGQVLVDGELAAGEDDGAGDGEVDRVARGGGRDLIAQRAGA